MIESFSRGVLLRPNHAVYLSLAALPAIVPLIMIRQYGVNAPFWDEWGADLAGAVIKAHQHTLSFLDLVAQHNEHRMLVPRLLWLPLSVLTHWNIIAEMVLGWTIACGSSFGILLLIRMTRGRFREEAPASFTPELAFSGGVAALWLLSNLMMFAPTQWENWLCGVSAANFAPPFFIIAALVSAASSLKPWPKVWLTIFFSAAATYSSGNGMLAWPVTAPLLAWPFSAKAFKAMKWPLTAWLAAALLLVGLYFVGYHKPLHGGSHPYATTLGSVIRYVPLFLGSPFAYITTTDRLFVANVAGCSMLVIFALASAYVAYRFVKNEEKEWCRSCLVWVMLASFSVVSGIWAGIGRGSLSSDQALSSRYITFSLYLPVALTMMIPFICDDLRRLRSLRQVQPWLNRLPVALAILLIAVDILEFPAADDAAKNNMLTRHEGKGGLLLINSLPDNPALSAFVFYDMAQQSMYPAILNRMGYLHPPLIASNRATDFQETNADAMGSPAGMLEMLAEPAPNEFAAVGWAVFRKQAYAADAVFLTYDDEKGQPIVLALAMFDERRPEVNQTLGADFGPCGWVAQFPAYKIPDRIRNTFIHAWTLNVSTGKAFKLAGEIKLNLR